MSRFKDINLLRVLNWIVQNKSSTQFVYIKDLKHKFMVLDQEEYSRIQKDLQMYGFVKMFEDKIYLTPAGIKKHKDDYLRVYDQLDPKLNSMTQKEIASKSFKNINFENSKIDITIPKYKIPKKPA